MKKTIAFLIICLPILSKAQGIQFEKELTWEQVKQKAKQEDKYIFLDCYTTWCGPCKAMDKTVYTNDTVASYFNNKFLSVKVQMDTSKQDNEIVRNWYHDAQSIQQKFNVTAFPTYLFFSPDSKLLHRGIGFQKTDKFIEIADNALNPHKQYYKLLQDYQNGIRDGSSLKELAKGAQSFGTKELANEIAAAYINILNEEDYLKKENIQFIRQFPQSSSSKAFLFFYNNMSGIDSIMHTQFYAQAYINNIIKKEEIEPIVKVVEKIDFVSLDWEKMAKKLSLKYKGIDTGRILTETKISWYRNRQDWPSYTKNLILYVVKYNKTGNWGLNNNAWEVFKYSENKKELRAVLKWSEEAMRSEPNAPDFIDTYANILYKLGRINSAIKWEKRAIKVDPSSTDLSNTLGKMKKGIPTWKVN